MGNTGRNGKFVLFSEMEDAAEAPQDSEERSRPRTDDAGLRSTTPTSHLSNIPASRAGTAASASGAAAEARGGGECWRSLATVASIIESALCEELGCRWVAVLPVSASPFDAWVQCAKGLHGQPQALNAPTLQLRGMVLKHQLKHDDRVLTYPVSLMNCGVFKSTRGRQPPLPPHIKIHPRHRQPPASTSDGVTRVVDVGGGALAAALEYLDEGGGSRLAGLQSVLRGSLQSAAAAMSQKHYTCNSEDVLGRAWNSDDATLLGSTAPTSLMVVPLVAGEGAPGEGELQALVVCGGKTSGFYPPHAVLVQGASSAILAALHTGMQHTRCARKADLAAGARSAVS